MRCDGCGEDFLEYEEVRMEQDGQWVEGKFEPVDSPRITHDECEDED